MENKKQINYTPNDRAIVDALKHAPEGLTLAGLIEATGLNLVPGHIVSAMKKGLIAPIGEVEVAKPAKRKVFTYNFVTGEILKNEKGEPHNYTDSAKAILAAASQIDSPFTLSDLATAMGVEKVASGSITHLVKKGNLSKGDQIEVDYMSKASVNVYGFVKDVPTAE